MQHVHGEPPSFTGKKTHKKSPTESIGRRFLASAVGLATLVAEGKDVCPELLSVIVLILLSASKKIVSQALQTDADLEMVEEEEDLTDDALISASEDAPVVKLVNLVMTDALKRGASDIHIEPYEKEFRVRFRFDGVCYEIIKPPLKLKAAYVTWYWKTEATASIRSTISAI